MYFTFQRDVIGEGRQGEKVLGFHAHITAIPGLRIFQGVPRKRLPGPGSVLQLETDSRRRSYRRSRGFDIRAASHQLGSVQRLGSDQSHTELSQASFKIPQREQQ